MSMSKTLSYGTDILFIIFAVYLFFYYFDIFLKRRKRTVPAVRVSTYRYVRRFTAKYTGGNIRMFAEVYWFRRIIELLLLLSLHCLRSLKFMRGSFGTNAFLQLPLMQSGC